jgi:hypothetical protein
MQVRNSGLQVINRHFFPGCLLQKVKAFLNQRPVPQAPVLVLKQNDLSPVIETGLQARGLKAKKSKQRIRSRYGRLWHVCKYVRQAHGFFTQFLADQFIGMR